MFSLVMQDEQLCIDLLNLILPDEDFTQIRRESHDIDFENLITTQSTLKFAEMAKGVRFDAYIKSKNTWAEIEMQTYTGSDIAKRSRYYQANMDIDALQKGRSYRELPTCYVVFICTFDYMKTDEPIYFFQNYDIKNQLPLNDNTYKIILNTKCSREKVPEKLRAFYDYINDPNSAAKDEFVERLEDRVKQYNTSDWRRNLMTLAELMEQNQEIGFEKGLEKGLAEGKLEIAREMKNDGAAIQIIAKYTGLTEEAINKL